MAGAAARAGQGKRRCDHSVYLAPRQPRQRDADHDHRGLPIDRTIRQKRLDLPSAHVARMPFAVKPHEPAHPSHALHLRTDAVMLDTNSVTYLVEQFGPLPHRGV
jgi:hypothetical protein